MMENVFDYAGAVSELEEILRKVEDPSTPLGELDAVLKRSKELVDSCRAYLRGAREQLETINR